ncbi:toll/interleukin-1 receptor domain-containing protein [Nevskia soli]|uniref:toll/interleukin-1 receptor domain-containing protein n=1 Tax=Nevskia soli TaxID=418856 RepID=UPI000A0465B0|nr:toll/interleukin-1 receptor domain-containing protein [Nevskia soli]
MVQYVTKSELRNIAAQSTIIEQAQIRKSLTLDSTTTSTFLSHSSKDDDLVVGAIKVLRNHGANVYIDEVDPSMPPYTTEETAELLKSRIQHSKRFVLLASANSKESRWVPWELGIADGYKGTRGIALFPAVDSQSEDWASWEYLGLYRKIVWGEIRGRQGSLWMVLDTKRNTGTPLRDWLTG